MTYQVRLYTPLPNGRRDCSSSYTRGTVYAATFEIDDNGIVSETGYIHDNHGYSNHFDPRDKIYNSHWVEVGSRTEHEK